MMSARQTTSSTQIQDRFPNLLKLASMSETKCLPNLEASITISGRHMITSIGGGGMLFVIAGNQYGNEARTARLHICSEKLQRIISNPPQIDGEHARIIELLCGFLVIATKQDFF